MNKYAVYFGVKEVIFVTADDFVLHGSQQGIQRLTFFIKEADIIKNIAVFNWNKIFGFEQIE